MFQTGEYNVLASTCVGEEGLDVGEVDLIVCYDATCSPGRLTQRMGRTGPPFYTFYILDFVNSLSLFAFMRFMIRWGDVSISRSFNLLSKLNLHRRSQQIAGRQRPGRVVVLVTEGREEGVG